MTAGDRGKIVITGANGFIGRHLVHAVLESGWSVTALTPHTDWLLAIRNPCLQVVAWEATDNGTCDDLLDGADAVCHLAAFIPPDFVSTAYASRCFQINTMSTLELLDASVRAGVKRFIYFSSGNVYLPVPHLVKETDLVYPSHRASIYLTSKLAAEILSESFRVTGRIPVSILRVSSVYGPGMSPHGSMARFAESIRRNQTIELYDGGRHVADFVHVGDVIQATLQVIDRQGDGIFNIGSGVATSMLQVAHAILDFYEASRDLIHVSPVRSDAAFLGYSGLDVTRARMELQYVPTDFPTGLQRWLSVS